MPMKIISKSILLIIFQSSLWGQFGAKWQVIRLCFRFCRSVLYLKTYFLTTWFWSFICHNFEHFSRWDMCSMQGLLIFCGVNKSVLLQTHKCRKFLMSICIYLYVNQFRWVYGPFLHSFSVNIHRVTAIINQNFAY